MTKKLLVWDGDNTLWDGTILEDVSPKLPPHRYDLCQRLHDLGCLQAVASRNSLTDVELLLHRFRLSQFFLVNQADFVRSKWEMIRDILVNLGLNRPDEVVFVDDDPINAAEVASHGVTTFTKVDHGQLLALFNRKNPTFEDRNRVSMYRSELLRREAGQAYSGDRIEFMRGCSMTAKIQTASLKNLSRIVALVERANRFSAVAYPYNETTIEKAVEAGNLYTLHAADRFGSYGISGVAHCCRGLITLLVISCRVQGKGYGSAFLGWLINHCGPITARWIETPYNNGIRALYEWYRFSVTSDGKLCTATSDTTQVTLPDWICITYILGHLDKTPPNLE